MVFVLPSVVYVGEGGIGLSVLETWHLMLLVVGLVGGVDIKSA
jgi:hypothetical protein